MKSNKSKKNIHLIASRAYKPKRKKERIRNEISNRAKEKNKIIKRKYYKKLESRI